MAACTTLAISVSAAGVARAECAAGPACRAATEIAERLIRYGSSALPATNAIIPRSAIVAYCGFMAEAEGSRLCSSEFAAAENLACAESAHSEALALQQTADRAIGVYRTAGSEEDSWKAVCGWAQPMPLEARAGAPALAVVQMGDHLP